MITFIIFLFLLFLFTSIFGVWGFVIFSGICIWYGVSTYDESNELIKIKRNEWFIDNGDKYKKYLLCEAINLLELTEEGKMNNEDNEVNLWDCFYPIYSKIINSFDSKKEAEKEIEKIIQNFFIEKHGKKMGEFIYNSKDDILKYDVIRIIGNEILNSFITKKEAEEYVKQRIKKYNQSRKIEYNYEIKSVLKNENTLNLIKHLKTNFKIIDIKKYPL